MEWLYNIPIVVWCFWVFVFGLGIGSFLNVLIARLPYEKSVLWPGSRCMTCLRPLRIWDNLPIVGYLRLRGRCRFCGTTFSSRYLWIELGTGTMFLGLFVLEILGNWHAIPGLNFHPFTGMSALPPAKACIHFLSLAFLFSILLASSMIDLKFRIIPGQLTYTGTLVGIAVSTFCPWPFPSEPSALPNLVGNPSWILPQWQGKIPTGLALWPFWGPPPSWAPAGSWQMGLLTGLCGALAGQFAGRAVKFLFEIGFRRDSLGLGDADLMMMAGAFLGWQIAVLSLPAGAMILLPIVVPLKIIQHLMGKEVHSELPFGPGIALGIAACWLGWHWIGELVRLAFFDSVMLFFLTFVVGGSLLVMGLILRRGPIETTNG